MIKEIEIIEGHNYADYFWIRPVVFIEHEAEEDVEVRELKDELSIQESDVESFLAYFFYKYYDNSLKYNSLIEPLFHSRESGFEWYLTYNFFTYETINKMCDEILEMADLFENDYNNTKLIPFKKHFTFCYQCDIDCGIRKGDGWECLFNVEKNIGIVIRFYRRFVKLIREIMEKNPQTHFISIMGP